MSVKTIAKFGQQASLHLSRGSANALSTIRAPEGVNAEERARSAFFKSLQASFHHVKKDSLAQHNAIIITGGSGEIGRRFVLGALEKGFKKIFIQSNKMSLVTEYLKKSGGCKGSAMQDKLRFISREFSPVELNREIPSDVKALSIVNCVGGTPDQGYTEKEIRDYNLAPLEAFIGRVDEMMRQRYQEGSSFDKLKIINISSIAASYLPQGVSSYADVRREIDEEVLPAKALAYTQEYGVDASAMGLRLGVVVQDLLDDFIYASGYSHGLSDLAHYPAIPAIGSPNLSVQPVHVFDVVEAAFNALLEYDVDNGTVVDAVSENNTYPYSLFMATLHPKLHSGLYSVSIPVDTALELVKLLPAGHFQEYAVKFIQQQMQDLSQGNKDFLDGKNFKTLLGREPINVMGYLMRDKSKVICVKPEALKFLLYAIVRVAQDPEQALKTAVSMLKNAPQFRVQKVKVDG